MTGESFSPYLKYGGMVIRKYEAAGHIFVDVAREADVTISPSGVLLCPGAEVWQAMDYCKHADCIMPRCSRVNEWKLNQAVTRVLRSEGDYTFQVVAPRLAEDKAELRVAVEAIKRAFWNLMGEVPGLDVYGGFVVGEWHVEGVTRERAIQAMQAKVRARFPLHLHAELPAVGVPAHMVPVIEYLANVLLREALNEDIYRGNLPMGSVDDDIQAIRNKDKRDSVPYVRLVPTSEVGSEWFKAGYLLKHLNPAESPYHDSESKGVLSDAGVIARHHEVNALLPGSTKGYYGWAYPGADGRTRSFFSMASGWDKKKVMSDTYRRICGGEYKDAETGLTEVWNSVDGLYVEVTHRGVTMSEVVPGRVVASSYLRLKLDDALHMCRLDAEARLMGACEAESARIEDNYAQLRVIKADRRTRFTEAMYAALSAVLSVLAQERTLTMQELLRGLLAPLDTKKAAHVPPGFALVLLDVQSTAEKARAPPRHTCRPPTCSVISTVHVRPTILFNSTTKAGLTQYRNPGFHMLRRDYLGFGVSRVGKALGIDKPPNHYLTRGFVWFG